MRLLLVLLGFASASVPTGIALEVPPPHGDDLASKKGAEEASPRAVLATLAQLHTDECVPLDAESPSVDRFDTLLADRATGQTHPLDGRLLELLRGLSKGYPLARFELVSGYRSPKFNEMLRKKGHHVASRSQHTLGHALDFRVVPSGSATPLDPRDLEKAIRALGWKGGTGTYLGKEDRFVHADVGPDRRWRE